MNYAIIAFLLVWFTAIVMIGNHRAITKYFNLVDKRTYLSGQENYQKLNQLIEYTEVHLYVFDSYDGESQIVLTVEYKEKGQTVEARFTGVSFDKVVEKAHAWAVERGYIKE